MPRSSMTRATAAWITLALSAGALVSVPAHADRRSESEACRQSLEDAKARNLRLRQQAAMDRVEIDRLRQTVANLEQELASRRTATVRQPTSESVAPIVRRQPAIESSDLELETPTTPIELRPPTASSEARPTSPPPVAVPARDADALQAIYDEGYTLFHRQRYDEAEARFTAFLAQSGDSDLADNAHFWVGECRFARGDLQSALDAFTEVVDRYPKGNKVPDAMIKAGKTLEALGDREAARTTYLEVQSRFPGTAAAATAAELVKTLE